MNGRVYDPVLGQFLNPDPFISDPTSTMGYNRYAYCNYNPLKFTDPSGYISQSVYDAIRYLLSPACPYGGSWISGGGGGGNTTRFNSSDDAYAAGAAYNNMGGNIVSRPSNYQIHLPRILGILGTPAGRDKVTGVASTSIINIPGWIINIFRGDGSGGPMYNSYSPYYDLPSGIFADYISEPGNPGQGGGANVYIEKDGIGHAFIEVNGTVFSYGRYNGSYSPSMGRFGPAGPGVLIKYSGNKASQFINDRIAKYPTDVYSINSNSFDATSAYNYLNGLYNSGTPNANGPGMIIDTYFIVGNNCSTIVGNALNAGGFSTVSRSPAELGSFLRGALSLQQFLNQ